MSQDKSYFFCGIGGSGMLPLATILIEQGATVAGSDRALDQGRLGEKFGWLEERGMKLYAQDGSGLVSGDQILVASAAVEDSVPDIAKGKELGCRRVTRAELLAELFNASTVGIAVGGTSGKSTVTGMIGWILTVTGFDPTIMNGAVMKNFTSPDAPFASARVGTSGVFVSEVDESDGSIALYRPKIAVLNNISLDHKSMEELRQLFGDFLCRAETAVANIDDSECYYLLMETDDREDCAIGESVTFGFGHDPDLTFDEATIIEGPTDISAEMTDSRNGERYPMRLQVPGRHNLANALAAVAASHAAGVPVTDAVAALGSFTGLARRFDIIGTTASGITVIDDFGHNPDKISATLDTLKAFPGRVIAFFQPHGFGPLRVMGKELAEVFAAKLDANDRLFLCDPVYFGGTTDKSIGSDFVVAEVNAGGTVPAQHIPDRDACGRAMTDIAKPGDRIVVMGARDDTLRQFASGLLEVLAKAGQAL